MKFMIGDHTVGDGAPVFCIAELSGNHNGSLERARELVAAAAAAGADAIKVQTYTPETITLRSDRPEFRANGPWSDRLLADLYAEAMMPWDWQPTLMADARTHAMEFFSSAFDPTAVAFLEDMHVPCHKIASFELVDLPLIECMAATGRPLIMSTGMATLAEIDEAVQCARAAGARDIALLACTSAYPAPAHDARLARIAHMASSFSVVVGLSDHTIGPEVPIAAVALGAQVIEKHFTLRRADGGVDSSFSLEPQEFAAMVTSVRTVEAAIGDAHYGPTEADVSGLQYRRSLFIVRDMHAGEIVDADAVRSVRPSSGLHPRHLRELIGRRVCVDVAAGTPANWDLFE